MTLQRIRRAAAGFVLLVAVGASPVEAQQDQWFGITYGAALSSGDTGDFIDRTSWRNFAFEWAYFTRPELAWGFTAAWTVFDQRLDDATASFEGVDIHGTQWRYVNAFPLLVTARYFVTGREFDNDFDIFIGAGAGTIYAENRVEVGTFAVTDNNWHFALAPEAGLTYPIRRDFVGYLQARYNYGFSSGGTDQQFWNFNVGLAWRK